VIYLNCTMMHGLTNLKFLKVHFVEKMYLCASLWSYNKYKLLGNVFCENYE
jgi:hypothetical protein